MNESIYGDKEFRKSIQQRFENKNDKEKDHPSAREQVQILEDEQISMNVDEECESCYTKKPHLVDLAAAKVIVPYL